MEMDQKYVSDNDSGSDDSSNGDFSEIAMYFEEKVFAEFSSLEKKMFMNQKRRYERSRAEMPDLAVQAPQFMIEYSNRILKRKRAAERIASKKARTDNPILPQRSSGRLKEALSDKTLSEEPNVHDEPVEDGVDFEVKIYFTPSEWSKMALLVKRHAQNALEDYQNAINKGIDAPLPKFMKRESDKAAASSVSKGVTVTPTNHLSVSKETASSSVGKGVSVSKETASSSGLSQKRSFKSSIPSSNGRSFDSTLDNQSSERYCTDVLTPFKSSAIFKTNINCNRNAADEEIEIETDMHQPVVTDGQPLSDLDLDEVKSAIEKAIKSAVPKIQASILADLQDTLESKGVESVDDFSLVDSSYFDGHGLKEIQVKKIMAEFQKHGSDKENMTKPKKASHPKKPPVPLMKPIVEQPTIASRPQLSTKVIDVGVMDLLIDFSKFSDSLLSSLEKKQVPTASDRVRMVSIWGHDIYEKYKEMRKNNPSLKQKTPGRDVYKKVVAAMFVEYEDCFKDTLNNKKYKTGTWSLENQLETCVENLFRPDKPRGERATPIRGNRSAACILPEKFSIAMTKKMQGEAETIRKNLVSIYRAPRDKWDWPAIKEMLRKESSLGAQRSLINSRKRDITFITEKWPFLSELSGLLSHLDEITGQSLAENFETFVDNSMDDLISYLLAMSPQRIKLMRLKKELDYGSGEHRRLFAALFMLAVHWGEEVSLLASLVEDTTLPHEVEDILDLPLTPHIVALGTSFYTAKKFFVFLDQKCLCSNLSNALEALEAMCAAYFIFGVLYPHRLSFTLTYFERMVANLSDGDGLLKAQTPKGAPALSSFSKVKKLTEDIEQFQKELLGDD